MNNVSLDGISLKLDSFAKKNAIPRLDVGISDHGQCHYFSHGIDSNSAADVFEIGSIGKTLTATLLATLVRSGTVKLEDTVDKFRPEYPFSKNITLRELATHTSGLPANPVSFSPFSHSKNIEIVQQFKKTDLNSYLTKLNTPLKRGKFRYSNLGMALLGNILGDCAGSNYEEAIKLHILAPLNMGDTHLSPHVYPRDRLNKGHDPKGQPIPPFLWEGMEPAGVWRSTARDMLCFLNAHLGYAGEVWENVLADTTQQAIDSPKLNYIGLAWLIWQNKTLGRCAWHNGGTFGQRSMAIIAKEQNKAIILLSNKVPSIWQLFFPRYSTDKLARKILESA